MCGGAGSWYSDWGTEETHRHILDQNSFWVSGRIFAWVGGDIPMHICAGLAVAHLIWNLDFQVLSTAAQHRISFMHSLEHSGTMYRCPGKCLLRIADAALCCFSRFVSLSAAFDTYGISWPSIVLGITLHPYESQHSSCFCNSCTVWLSSWLLCGFQLRSDWD